MRIPSLLPHIARARKLIYLLSVNAYRRPLLWGVAAAIEHERTPLPERAGTILDVGANRGQFALVATRRWPDAGLVCFEPLPKPRAVLIRVLGKRDGVRIVPVALSDREGPARMHISRADDSSSLLPITARQVEAFPGTAEVAAIDVPTRRLDEEVDGESLRRPTVLKLDVQGFELKVLAGGAGLLPYVDAIVVECSFAEFYEGQASTDDVIRFLHHNGFALVAVTTPTIDKHGAVLQADLVFSATPFKDGGRSSITP